MNSLDSFLSSALASGSSIDARSTSLTDQQKSITNEQDSITARTAVIQQRYLTQFNAMDTLLSKLQSTSTYLTQQFNALNKSSTG
jgi:flagellar hook-associated protein 2